MYFRRITASRRRPRPYFALLYQPSDRPETAQFANDIHNAFATIVNFTPQFVFGSLIAYLVSQRFDVWAFHKIKALTGGRWLWLRNNLSTLSSQAIDTTVFTLIVWAPVVGISTAMQLGFAKYFFKFLIAAIDTVFIYWARHSFLKHHPSDQPLIG
jgi:uncharacterized integral membrane protein (TIGR00697 family)